MFQRQLGRHLGRHLLVLPLLAGLAGCELDSPVGVSVPGLPIPGGTIGSTSHTTVTGNLAARKAAIQPIAERYATAQGLPVGLVMAVIEQESGFQPGVTSSAGAQGLMQLMPDTAKGLGVNNAFDPKQNVEGGVKLLAQNLQRYGGDTSKALAAYNAGAGNVDKYGGVPPFAETQNYVKNITAMMNA